MGSQPFSFVWTNYSRYTSEMNTSVVLIQSSVPWMGSLHLVIERYVFFYTFGEPSVL